METSTDDKHKAAEDLMRASGVASLLVKLLSVMQKPEPAGWLDVAPTENHVFDHKLLNAFKRPRVPDERMKVPFQNVEGVF